MDLYNAASGRSLTREALFQAAERLVNLERCHDAREGLTRKDDKLPRRFFRSFPGGVNKGKALDPEKMEEMITMYYQARGWDPETGKPLPDTLNRLGLEQEAVDMAAVEITVRLQDRVNKTLPENVKIHRYTLLHKEFDADEGELTKSRKLRRSFLEERYGDLLSAAYGNKQEIAIEADVKYRDGRVGKTKTNLKIRTTAPGE